MDSSRNYFFENIDPEIDSLVREGAAVFERLGAELVEIELPGAEEAQPQATIQIYCDAANYHRHRLENEPEAFSKPIYDRMSRGLEIKGVELAAALRFKEQWMRTVGEAFDAVDMILSPTTPIPPLPLEDAPDLHELTARAAQALPTRALSHQSQVCRCRAVSRKPAARWAAIAGGLVERPAFVAGGMCLSIKDRLARETSDLGDARRGQRHVHAILTPIQFLTDDEHGGATYSQLLRFLLASRELIGAGACKVGGETICVGTAVREERRRLRHRPDPVHD